MQTWESIDRADEREQDMIMPTAGGSDAEKAAIQIVLNKIKHVFGKPPIGGSKLRPMSIELKQGAVQPRPAAAGRVSPEILNEIGEDTPMRIDNGWTRAARVGGRCWFAPLSLQLGSQAKSKRRICGEFRLINDCCFLHTYPTVSRMHRRSASSKDSTFFGKADLSKGYSQLR